MKIGDIKTIYHDTIDKTDIEGGAKLIRPADNHGIRFSGGKEIQTWMVEFIDQLGEYFPRTILVD